MNREPAGGSGRCSGPGLPGRMRSRKGAAPGKRRDVVRRSLRSRPAGRKEGQSEGSPGPVDSARSGFVGAFPIRGHHGLQIVEHGLAQLVERPVVARVRGDVLHEDEVLLGRTSILGLECQVALGQVAVARAFRRFSRRHEADGVRNELVPLRHGLLSLDAVFGRGFGTVVFADAGEAPEEPSLVLAGARPRRPWPSSPPLCAAAAASCSSRSVDSRLNRRRKPSSMSSICSPASSCTASGFWNRSAS